METIEQRIQSRITEIEQARDACMQEANIKLAAMSTAIAELKALIEPPAVLEPAEQAKEAAERG